MPEAPVPLPEAPDPAAAVVAAPLVAAPLSAAELVAREWPGLRASIIDIAATLDRLDAAGPAKELSEARTQAETLLRTLLDVSDGDRAQRLLEQLSRPYDPKWRDAFAISADS